MSVVQFIAAHQLAATVGLLYVGSAAVSSLPQPGSGLPATKLCYQWFFCFTHTLLNNVEQAARAKYPQLSSVLNPIVLPAGSPHKGESV